MRADAYGQGDKGQVAAAAGKRQQAYTFLSAESAARSIAGGLLIRLRMYSCPRHQAVPVQGLEIYRWRRSTSTASPADTPESVVAVAVAVALGCKQATVRMR